MRTAQLTLTVLACSILAACGGGGGANTPSSAQTPAPVVQTPVQQPTVQPLRVFATSYENKNSISFTATQLSLTSFTQVVPTEAAINSSSIAVADFFQNGTYSVFASSQNVTGTNAAGVPDAPGYAHFFKRNNTGAWVDASDELFASTSDRVLCVNGGAQVADFNNDGKPDVFVNCTGIDAPPTRALSTEEAATWWDSYQVVLLSQPNGKYKSIKLPHWAYGYQAAAADINNDGNADVVVANNPPYVLLGNGDGTFRRDDAVLNSKWRDAPNAVTNAGAPAPWFGIDYSQYGVLTDDRTYSIQLIPINGRIDIVAGDAYLTHWTKGKQGGGFDWSTTTVFPAQYSAVGSVKYQFPLDVLYNNGSFYFHTTAYVQNGVDWAILKYSADSMLEQTIYNFVNTSDNFQPYSTQIKWNTDGVIRAYTGACADDTTLGMCGLHVPG